MDNWPQSSNQPLRLDNYFQRHFGGRCKQGKVQETFSNEMTDVKNVSYGEIKWRKQLEMLIVMCIRDNQVFEIVVLLLRNRIGRSQQKIYF